MRFNPAQAADRPVRERRSRRDRLDAATRSPTCRVREDCRPRDRRRGLRRRRCPGPGGGSTGRSTGSDDRPPCSSPVRDGHLRSPRQGVHRSCIPTCREDLRGTYGGLVSEAAIAHLRDLGGHGRRAHAGAPGSPTKLPPRARPVETTGATRRSGTSHRTASTRAVCRLGEHVAR